MLTRNELVWVVLWAVSNGVIAVLLLFILSKLHQLKDQLTDQWYEMQKPPPESIQPPMSRPRTQWDKRT